MKQLTIQSTLILSLLFLTGCHKRECLTNDAYNGLYNALTCDYESRLITLDNRISEKALNNLQLFTAYQELVAKVSQKEKELVQYQRNIQETDAMLNEIEQNLEKMNTKHEATKLLSKIRYQVIAMRDNINTYQPQFSTDEIYLAKQHIKSNTGQKSQKEILAKKFLEQQMEKRETLKEAYQEGYEENRKVQHALQERLNESIQIVLMGEKANHLDDESKKRLLVALKETKRYTSTVK